MQKSMSGFRKAVSFKFDKQHVCPIVWLHAKCIICILVHFQCNILHRSKYPQKDLYAVHPLVRLWSWTPLCAPSKKMTLVLYVLAPVIVRKHGNTPIRKEDWQEAIYEFRYCISVVSFMWFRWMLAVVNYFICNKYLKWKVIFVLASMLPSQVSPVFSFTPPYHIEVALENCL